MRGDFLFSIDLEDVRDHVPNGHLYSERVPANTERYLSFLKTHGVQATFFVVGRVAERYPGLIRDIVAEGHEVACHTHAHVQLDKHTPESLGDDLKQNLEALHRCGANEVVGFRAPTFSMIEKTRWAYPVLEELGFDYSSSVIPARNPLYGWPQFGSEPRRIGRILEMPITLHSLLRVPIAGGVHFRVLPMFFIERGVRKLARRGQAILSYFHPYEIDSEQERFMHPDLSESRIYNALMYVGRSRVLPRLERLMKNCRFTSYREYLRQGPALMRTVVSLDLSSDADLERWQAYVLARPDTHYSDLGQWRRIFAELYGIRSVNLMCVDDGRTLGIASLYLIASPFFGRLLVTCPFFGYGGLYADDPAAERLLLDEIDRAAEELRVDFVELRLRRPLDSPYQVRHDFLEFELALGESEQSVWRESLSSNARQNVRRSEKQQIAFSTTRDPRSSFLLLSRTLRDLGTPFHSRRFFDLLLEHLGEQVQFSQVHLGDRLVAAGVMLRFRDRLSTPYIGSLRRYRATRANYCQYWGIIRHCLETGIRRFDLGRSPRGSSHQQFKQKWGAVPVEVHYGHRALTTRRAYRNVTEPGRVELLASEVWKRLPLAFTCRAGHWASRYIP